MALFDKSNSKSEENAVSQKTGGADIDTLLGKGSEFDGKLVFKGQVRIDGAPVGEYELEYWHPRWAGSTNELARQPLRLNGADRHTLVIGAQP